MTSASPHVVVDVRMLRHAGIGTYIRNVVPRIIAARADWRFTLIANRSGESPDWFHAANVTTVSCSAPIYSIREQAEIPLRAPARASVYWSPHYNIPLFSKAPLVVTVHDTAHLALTDIHGSAVRQLYARQMLAAVRRRARVILFDSAFSASEFTKYVGAPLRKAVTIHLGVDPSWSTSPAGPAPHHRPYVLFVGSVKPHKNLLRLLQAFQRLLGSVDHDLLIVGARTGQRSVDEPALALGESLAPRVQFIDGVADDQLKRYVAGATALVLPSLYEGFGLPALEAMAAGCPCVVSSAASLPEVCGEAALYCDPLDVDDMANQIHRAVTNPELCARLVAAGRERAALFDWNITATTTAAVLDEVITGRAA